MAPAKGSPDPKLEALIALTKRYETLLTRFLQTITAAAPSHTPSQPTTTTTTTTTTLSQAQQTINPLRVLYDAATLLKAHTTKLSLLVLNKPFTPTAITGELKKAVEECVVCMVSAVEMIDSRAGAEDAAAAKEGGSAGAEGAATAPAADKEGVVAALAAGSMWGESMAKEAHVRVARVIREVIVMVGEVRSVAEEEEKGAVVERKKEGKKGDAKGKASRDTLSSTGIVWEACDLLMELDRLGVAGLAVQKAMQYQEMLADAIEELKEWAEDVEDEEDDDGDEGSGDEDDEFDDLFSAANKLPKENKELRAQLDGTIKKLKTVKMLYQALIKRRLKPFTLDVQNPAHRARVETLNKLTSTLQSVSEMVDDLASSFYDLDGNAAEKLLTKCTATAVSGAQLVRLNWDGKEDEFTSWSTKWEDAISTAVAA